MQRFLIALGVLLVAAAIAVLVSYPTDSSPIVRQRVIDSAQENFPDYVFSHAGDVTLFAAKGDGVWAIDLTMLQSICQDGRNACDKATAALMQELKRTFAPVGNYRVTDLRPTLAGPPAAWTPGAQVLSEPIAGDLRVSFGFFKGESVQYLTSGLAVALGLNPAKVRPVSLDAMQSDSSAPILRPLLGHKGLSYIDAERDPSGEVLSFARLNVLLEKTGLKQVALAVPTRSMLVVANPIVPADIDMLRGFVGALTQRPQAHVVSRQLFLFDGSTLTELN